MGEPVGIVIIMVGGSHGGNMQPGTADKPDKIDEADVLEKLSTVQDPHLRRDIVSLGFVKNIKICSPIISFDIERSSPTSLVRERLKTEAEVAVKGLPGIEEVNVSVSSTQQARQHGKDRSGRSGGSAIGDPEHDRHRVGERRSREVHRRCELGGGAPAYRCVGGFV